MNSLLIVVFLALAFFSYRSDKVTNPCNFRSAWITFACIAFTNAVAAVFRAVTLRDMDDMALVEIWSLGFQWLFLGLSIFHLGKAVAPTPGPRAVSPTPPRP